MPEGDTVWLAAERLRAALAGQVLIRTDFRVPRYATVNLAGFTVTEVLSRGKHLLIRATDGTDAVTVHSHLKMEGAWHLYRRGQKWRRPAFSARAILETADLAAVGFSLGTVDVLARNREDQVVGHLGPDLLGPDWDAGEALRRLRMEPERPVGLALLDQRNLAGIGNVYRNELCFLAGVHPATPVRAVPRLERMIETAQLLLTANRNRTARTTTGAAGPSAEDRMWVHRRERLPCRRCGTTVLHGRLGRDATDARDIFFCPHCQPQLETIGEVPHSGPTE